MTRLFLTLILLCGISVAQDSTGYAIMEQALNKKSWNDMKADLTLNMMNARNEKRSREIEFFSSDDAKGLNRMLMRFTAPADVRGTGFLTQETPSGDDERYLYLPALRRVKKIATSGSGGNFMSSDFTYYDIGKPKLEDWTYRLLGEEVINGTTCYKIECLPADKKVLEDTGYGKIIRWVNKDRLTTVKSDYYDKGLKLWKQLTVNESIEIKGIDFSTDMEMEDIQIAHKSRMIFSNVAVDTNLPDVLFSVRYLQRSH